MREKLQGCPDIIPTVGTHNGFKNLTVLFPIRLPRVSRDWCRRKSCLSRWSVVDRRSKLSRDFKLCPNISVVGSPPSLMSYEGNPVSLFRLHLVVFLLSVFLGTLHPEVSLSGLPECRFRTSYYLVRRT